LLEDFSGQFLALRNITMTTYLLDTCILSETSRAKPHPNIVKFVENAGNLCLPTAALVEFQRGIMDVCRTDPIKAVKLSAWYQQLMRSGIPILDTDREVAEIWGTLASDRRLLNLTAADPRAKRPRHGQDVHIAAVSLAHRIPIATVNARDFLLINSHYPLPGIYDPIADKWHARVEPIWQFSPTPLPQSTSSTMVAEVPYAVREKIR
jgi:predicted nucleic acid-binding protein